MNNKIIVAVIIVFCICAIGGIFVYLNKSDQSNVLIQKINNIDNEKDIGSENKLISNIKVIINAKTYNATLEENETTKQFLNMLPKEFEMNELNGNEKYVYLETSLPTNPYSPKQIEAGDIMLFGNNCLVVFYKSFTTSYSYTKIGHIDNIPNLGNKDMVIKFEK